jgi:hypothetical protein
VEESEMALKAKLKTLDGLDETVAAEYTAQEDGTFILDVEAVGTLELADTAGLKSALGKERANAKKALESAQRFGDLDPDKARDALKKVDEMAGWDPDKEVAEKIKAREKQLIERHEAEKADLTKLQKALESQLEQNLIIAAATKAISEHDGSLRLLLPHVKTQTRMRKTPDGQFIAEVIGPEGNPRVGDSAGNPMTIPQLVEEMKADEAFAPAFKGTGSSGSGAGETPTGGKAPPAARADGKKPKMIPASDQAALNANVDAIAKGEVVVDFTK